MSVHNDGRRRSPLALAAALFVLLAGIAAMRSSASAAAGPRLAVSAVDSVGMTVSDMDRAVAFYTGAASSTRSAQ